MGPLKQIAALFSQARYAQFVAAYGPRYIAFATAVFALFATAAAAMVAQCAIEYRTLERLQATGQATSGTIVDLEIESNRKRSSHQAWVTYSFPDRNGIRHNATDYRQFRAPPGLSKMASIDVIYDPTSPQISRLLVDISNRLDDLKMGVITGLFGFVLFGVFVGRYIQWRRSA